MWCGAIRGAAKSGHPPIMLTISCIFDEESGRDGMDPLGKLVISDGQSEFTIEVTYLDSWLAGLVGALEKLKAGKEVTVETEEPKPIQIEVGRQGCLQITYDGTVVRAVGPKEFEVALRAAVGSFLNTLKDVPDAWRNRDVDPIRRFWVTTQN
jgi:hypothetical protein